MKSRRLFALLFATFALGSAGCAMNDPIFTCGSSMPCNAMTHFCAVNTNLTTLQTTTTCTPLPTTCTGTDYCQTCFSAANMPNQDQCRKNSTGTEYFAYLVSSSSR